ncbi:MAG: hypothetical protein ACUVQ0_04620 [Thermoproteota archaeon]
MTRNKNKIVSTLMFSTIIALATIILPIVASPPGAKPTADPCTKAEKIIWVAESAKNFTEKLVNYVSSNETIISIIEEADLIDDFNGSVSRLNEGVTVLEEARNYLNEGDCANATKKAIQALKVFKEVFRDINKILCSANIKHREVFDGQGLIIAMEVALKRVEKLEELAENIEEKGVNVSEVLNVLNEAKQYLNIDEARVMLQQGNVSGVARMLIEANKLIAKASLMLNEKNRELIFGRIKQYLERMRERIRERLKGMNMTENEFFKYWNFTNAEEFWRERMEFSQRIKRRIEKKMFNETIADLKNFIREMHEFRFKFEERIRQRE